MGTQCLKFQNQPKPIIDNIDQIILTHPHYIGWRNTENEEINQIEQDFASFNSNKFISPKYIPKKIFKEDLDLLEIQKQFNTVIQESFYSCKTIIVQENSQQKIHQSTQNQSRPLKGILKQKTQILIPPIISKKRLYK